MKKLLGKWGRRAVSLVRSSQWHWVDGPQDTSFWICLQGEHWMLGLLPSQASSLTCITDHPRVFCPAKAWPGQVSWGFLMTAGPLSQGTCLHSGIKMQGFTAIPRTGQHSGAPHGGEGSSFGKKGTRKAPTLRAPLHVCAHLPCSLGAIFQGRPKFVPLIQKWSGPLETLMRPREGKTSSHTRLLSKFVPRADAPGSKGSLEVPRGRLGESATLGVVLGSVL